MKVRCRFYILSVYQFHQCCCESFAGNAVSAATVYTFPQTTESESERKSCTLYGRIEFCNKTAWRHSTSSSYMLLLLSTHNHWLLPSTNFSNTNNQSSVRRGNCFSLSSHHTTDRMQYVFRKSILSVAFHVFLSPLLLSYLFREPLYLFNLHSLTALRKYEVRKGTW